MLEFTLWVALENEGLGASLQHYNPLIDAEVRKSMGDSRKLASACANAFWEYYRADRGKEFKPIEERVRVFR